MRSNLVIRIQKLFRRSDYIPEGADTSDEHWDDLPYGGPGLRAGAAASTAGQEQSEREWSDLLSWGPAAQARAATSPPPAAGLASANDEQEWAAAVARAKRPTLIGTGTPAIPAAKPAPTSPPSPARTAAPAPSLRPPGMTDDEAEWSQRLARAKARAESAPDKTSEEEAEWRSLIARAKAGPSLRRDLGDAAKAMGWMRAGAKAGAIG